MTSTSTTTVITAKASGYLQQLCKHFSHKTEVEFTPESGWIKFDFGKADLMAGTDKLSMAAQAQNDEDLKKLQHVLASHLKRFAFREELMIDWSK